MLNNVDTSSLQEGELFAIDYFECNAVFQLNMDLW
jgi:hypothetical protein